MKHYNAITIHNEDAVKTNEASTLLSPNVVQTNNPHPQDHLTPCFDCPHEDRPSTLLIGTFNLIASIVGGGTLSLPIVFSKCGIFFTTLAMILSAYITYMSLIMLCYSSRRRGGSSYGEVMRSAFGERMEEAVSWLLFIFLIFVIIGYMILIRDIWTPLVMLTPFASRLDVENGDYVLLGIICVLLPFLFQRSLHALRYNCYVGFVSVLILCYALGRGATHQLQDTQSDSTEGNGTFEIDFFKMPTFQEVLFSFPIITCSFLCHFNVNSIQNALNQPTRKRMQHLLVYAIVACFLLMYMLGMGGYLYAGNAVEGNILLNVPIGNSQAGNDNEQIWLFTAGRIGIGTTITLAMPLMAIPCRNALLEIVDVWFHRSHHRRAISLQGKSEEQCCWNLFHTCNRNETIHDANITTEDEIVTEEYPLERVTSESSLLPRTSLIIRHDPITRDYIFRNAFVHYGSTLLIIAVCYSGAVLVRGVATVWSFIGSSMAFLIAFILPCGSFIVIESELPCVKDGGDRNEAWLKVAWIILVFAVVGSVVCTVNSVLV